MPADEDVLYTKQSKGEGRGCLVKLGEVRRKPACPLSLVIKESNARNREIK